ncbi:MAG: multiheme c-type cytochrome [Pirellulaceae bacterium]
MKHSIRVIHYFLLAFALTSVVSVVAYVATVPARPLISDAVHSQAGWADEASCIDCHEQAEFFSRTGHAQTLRPASDATSLEALRRVSNSPRLAAEGTRLEFDADRVFAVTGMESPGTSLADAVRVQLDWCFGSGLHAQTWTATLLDSSGATDQLEFRWSLYHGELVDRTPGQPTDPTDGRLGKLGVLFDGPKSARCFACHANYVPEFQGAIDERGILPGVTCQRCHGPRQSHVASDGEFSDPHWSSKDRLESVHRCAQCHRRADELTAEEVTTENKAIVRFQPVGLVQSKCFTHSQMTCTTCHDPHLPPDMQELHRIDQCVQCHQPDNIDHVTCGAGESSDCLRCHMPKVQMDAPVAFTDHWIRVRKDEDAR